VIDPYMAMNCRARAVVCVLPDSTVSLRRGWCGCLASAGFRATRDCLLRGRGVLSERAGAAAIMRLRLLIRRKAKKLKKTPSALGGLP
jgi:hypothetical protein